MNLILKTILFPLFFVLILFSGCEEQLLPEVVEFEKEQVFQVTKTYYSNNNQLKFNISEIRDSRCPEDVVCVWQGEAVIQIAVELPEIDTIELSTFDNLSDTVGNFSFELLDVSPCPVSTRVIEQEDYKVKMRIKELPADE